MPFLCIGIWVYLIKQEDRDGRRDRGQGSLSDKVKGSYRRVSVVMYVTLVIAAIAVFAAAYVPKQFSLAYTILVLIVFLITAVNDTRLIQRNSQKIVDAVWIR